MNTNQEQSKFGAPKKPWWKGAVIYQIWPRSFCDSDGDGVGDLNGIIKRLDYLNDGKGGGLGVDAIWMSPIFLSPLADFGYDVSGYTQIDPTYGTLEVFDELVTQAHARGMRVMLDWVPNHTSDQHPWFLESRSSTDNPKRDWYVWRDVGPQGPPNNWVSAFPSTGGAWTFDDHSGQYFLHSYTSNQPDLNWDNPDVRHAMLDTLRFWFERGVDGFRIDVVHRLGKDPLLADNEPLDLEPEPTNRGRHDADWPSVHDRIRAIRATANEFSDRLLVGEVYILNQARIADYVAGGDQLHLAHNFVFLNQEWDAQLLGATIAEFEELVGPDVSPAWCLNNHDHSRIRSRLDGDGLGYARARAAVFLLLGLRGSAFIYQGEELGLPDTQVPGSLIVDIDGRDGSRTPIPWEPPSVAGSGAGFTTGTPWLPVGETAEVLNAASLEGRPESMLELYRTLIKLRSTNTTLREGSCSVIGVSNEVLVIERRSATSLVVVLLNFSSECQPVPEQYRGETAQILASSLPPDEVSAGELAPLEARWIEQFSTNSTKLHTIAQTGN